MTLVSRSMPPRTRHWRRPGSCFPNPGQSIRISVIYGVLAKTPDVLSGGGLVGQYKTGIVAVGYLGSKKTQLIEASRSRLREKAIKNAKVRIALAGREVGDYTQDQLEIIVNDEEEKLVGKLKQSGVAVVLIGLGLGWF